MAFLEKWATDYAHTDIKILVSQTIFSNLSTSNGKSGPKDNMQEIRGLAPGKVPNKDHELLPDFDSNSWPQYERNKTLEVIRPGRTFMIGGDQHPASVVQHGTKEFEDSGYCFCIPATSNIAPRRWFPPVAGANSTATEPEYCGLFLDTFCNKITVKAVANPYDSPYEPTILHDRATGYDMVEIERAIQKITMHTYPRSNAPTDTTEFYGFPYTIYAQDNDGRKPKGDFGTMVCKGLSGYPVVQLIHERDNKGVYTYRGTSYTIIQS